MVPWQAQPRDTKARLWTGTPFAIPRGRVLPVINVAALTAARGAGLLHQHRSPAAGALSLEVTELCDIPGERSGAVEREGGNLYIAQMQTGEAGISVLISAHENEGLTRDASCFRSLSQQSA